MRSASIAEASEPRSNASRSSRPSAGESLPGRQPGPPPPGHRFSPDGAHLREVLSYSRRGHRLTPSQHAAWTAYADDWVIPGESMAADHFDLAGWFGRQAPLIVEIGSGVGEATAALAAGAPASNVLGFEVWRPGIAATLGLLAEHDVRNVRMTGVDAVWAFANRIEPGSVSELWTFFPDPWPKSKHHKRRLIDPSFAALATSRLAPGGIWRLATDWAPYAEVMTNVLDAEPGLSGARVERWAARPATKFERKGLRAGREIVDLAYRRT
ncbi:MAG: tRNA (guanosine(46)-N7)-methyltransferase TrmB [Nocardioides sp.]